MLNKFKFINLQPQTDKIKLIYRNFNTEILKVVLFQLHQKNFNKLPVKM